MTTELRELMTSAADDRPPHDLAGRALAGARHRRQQRLVVAGGIATAIVVAVGVVALSPLQRTSDEPRPFDIATQGVAPLPKKLPVPDPTTPELAAGSMRAASAAYIWDGRVVLTNAETAEAYVWNGEGIPPGVQPFQVRLSPDGATAAVALQSSQGDRSKPQLALLDLATASAVVVDDLVLSYGRSQPERLDQALIAWMPDSGALTCICSSHDDVGRPDAGIWSVDLSDETGLLTRVSHLDPVQISVGAGGLAYQVETGGAWFHRLPGRVDEPLGPGEVLAVSNSLSYESALVHGPRWLRLLHVSGLHKDDVWINVREAGSISSIHASSGGYVLVSFPRAASSGGARDQDALYARVATDSSEPRLLTVLPPGTTSTSFAAEAAW